MTIITEVEKRDRIPNSYLNPTSVTWTFDDDEILRDAWTRGITQSQIVALLPMRTIGQINHRRSVLGLTVAKTRREPHAPVPSAFTEPRTHVLTKDETLPPLTAAGRPWDQRRLFQCAFPVGEVDGMVHSCCARIDEPHGYCETHRKVMYRPRV
jgi:hypothetical protein